MHPQDRLFCEIAVQLNLLTREQVAACTSSQQHDARGRSVAALALSLGFMSQSGVDSVMLQQQRVLERRREARAASRAQREVESRAGAAKGRSRDQAADGTTAEARAPRRDPTPTTPWVHGERAARLRSQPLAPKPPLNDVDEVRETLDVRPPVRSSSREPAQIISHEGMLAPGVRPTVPIPQPAGAVSASAPTLLTTPAQRSTPQPYAAGGVSQVAAVTRERTHLGTGPRDMRSPPFNAAATSAPLPGPPPTAAASINATLLETSGREQKRRELAEAAERAPKLHAHPVPSGRDWRNPSRPPPPNAAFDAVEVPPAPRALPPEPPTGPLNPGEVRRFKAPALDTPHYIDRALELCLEFSASDLQLHTGALPCARVDGKLWTLIAEQRFAPADTARMVAEILDDARQLQLQVDGEMRFVYELPSGLRARAHVYASELGLNLSMRLLPREIAPPERLGLGPAMRALREAPFGLCVCSGPAGSGKTTSLYAMARTLAQERALHVVSIERPIEMLHAASLGMIEQREVGPHAPSFGEGIAWALRENADVIVVSDLLADGALAAALEACRARCLVLGGVRASSSAAALIKLMTHGRGDAEQLRADLAQGLRVLLQQRLLPKARVTGRVAVIEQLVNTPQAAQLIRDDKLQQLPALMAASKHAGTTPLDDALDELVRVGTITLEAARSVARRSERFHKPG